MWIRYNRYTPIYRIPIYQYISNAMYRHFQYIDISLSSLDVGERFRRNSKSAIIKILQLADYKIAAFWMGYNSVVDHFTIPHHGTFHIWMEKNQSNSPPILAISWPSHSVSSTPIKSLGFDNFLRWFLTFLFSFNHCILFLTLFIAIIVKFWILLNTFIELSLCLFLLRKLFWLGKSHFKFI